MGIALRATIELSDRQSRNFHPGWSWPHGAGAGGLGDASAGAWYPKQSRLVTGDVDNSDFLYATSFPGIGIELQLYIGDTVIGPQDTAVWKTVLVPNQALLDRVTQESTP
jgi:hypothetical protein